MQFKYTFILLVACCLLFMVSLEFVYWQLRKTKSLLLLPFFLCFFERNTFGRLNYVFWMLGGAVLIVSYKLKYRRSWLYISCLNCWLFDTGGYEVKFCDAGCHCRFLYIAGVIDFYQSVVRAYIWLIDLMVCLFMNSVFQQRE